MLHPRRTIASKIDERAVSQVSAAAIPQFVALSQRDRPCKKEKTLDDSSSDAIHHLMVRRVLMCVSSPPCHPCHHRRNRRRHTWAGMRQVHSIAQVPTQAERVQCLRFPAGVGAQSRAAKPPSEACPHPGGPGVARLEPGRTSSLRNQSRGGALPKVDHDVPRSITAAPTLLSNLLSVRHGTFTAPRSSRRPSADMDRLDEYDGPPKIGK